MRLRKAFRSEVFLSTDLRGRERTEHGRRWGKKENRVCIRGVRGLLLRRELPCFRELILWCREAEFSYREGGYCSGGRAQRRVDEAKAQERRD